MLIGFVGFSARLVSEDDAGSAFSLIPTVDGSAPLAAVALEVLLVALSAFAVPWSNTFGFRETFSGDS